MEWISYLLKKDELNFPRSTESQIQSGEEGIFWNPHWILEHMMGMQLENK